MWSCDKSPFLFKNLDMDLHCTKINHEFGFYIRAWLPVSSFTSVVESLVYFGGLLQGGGGGESGRQPNVNQSQEAGSGSALPGVEWSEWCGAEVQAYTCAVHNTTTVTMEHAEVLYSLEWLSTAILTSMRYSQDLAIRRLGTVNNSNLDNGFEDRTINCPAKDTQATTCVLKGWN